MLIFWEDVLFCYVLDYSMRAKSSYDLLIKKKKVFSSSTSKDLNYITEDYSYKSKRKIIYSLKKEINPIVDEKLTLLTPTEEKL